MKSKEELEQLQNEKQQRDKQEKILFENDMRSEGFPLLSRYIVFRAERLIVELNTNPVVVSFEDISEALSEKGGDLTVQGLIYSFDLGEKMQIDFLKYLNQELEITGNYAVLVRVNEYSSLYGVVVGDKGEFNSFFKRSQFHPQSNLPVGTTVRAIDDKEEERVSRVIVSNQDVTDDSSYSTKEAKQSESKKLVTAIAFILFFISLLMFLF